jgi:hypothetical protein
MIQFMLNNNQKRGVLHKLKCSTTFIRFLQLPFANWACIGVMKRDNTFEKRNDTVQLLHCLSKNLFSDMEIPFKVLLSSSTTRKPLWIALHCVIVSAINFTECRRASFNRDFCSLLFVFNDAPNYAKAFIVTRT